jgi:hypothetical protein
MTSFAAESPAFAGKDEQSAKVLDDQLAVASPASAGITSAELKASAAAPAAQLAKCHIART